MRHPPPQMYRSSQSRQGSSCVTDVAFSAANDFCNISLKESFLIFATGCSLPISGQK